MSVKKKIGRMIPYPAIEAGRKVIHAGFEKCAVCEGHVRHFTDFGYGFEVLERLQVVGGLRRAADVCPVCHSSSRERLIWFWLTAKGTGFRLPGSSRIAHFAPEKGLSRKLLEVAPANYSAYDIEPQRYRHLERVAYADLCKLGMADGSIDLLICNHVLEHVPDVATALSEICRVMAPGGIAILQVPIALRIDKTIELGLDSTPKNASACSVRTITCACSAMPATSPLSQARDLRSRNTGPSRTMVRPRPGGGSTHSRSCSSAANPPVKHGPAPVAASPALATWRASLRHPAGRAVSRRGRMKRPVS